MSNNTSFAGRLAGAMQADAEARELLGYEPDAVLSPAEGLRVQIVTALRSVIAGQLDAKSADPNKLLIAAEGLARLVGPTAAPSAPEPCVRGRERLEQLLGSETQWLAQQAEKAAELAALHAQISRLTDEVERLRGTAAAQSVSTPEVEVLPPEPKALPAPQATDGADRANAQRPPVEWMRGSPDPWREYLANDMPGPGRRRWQPT